ncbi:MAG: hypothetical protein WBG08_04620 [Litorimonas sp.]
MAIETARLRMSVLAGVSLLATAAPALAGPILTCGAPGGPVCDGKVTLMPTPPTYADAVTIENRTPYDYFDSIHFQRSPHVSITRVHGLDTTVGLSDSPKGFTGGCHPESTTYCRSGQAARTSAPVPAPAAPVYVPPAPKPYTPPVMSPPVQAAPPVCGQFRAVNPCGTAVSGGFVQSERVVAVGKVSPPSAFVPRIYGDPYTITPGIAHLPTSFIDRNPYSAQAVLDRVSPGSVTPALSGLRFAPIPPRPVTGHVGFAPTLLRQASGMSAGRYGQTTRYSQTLSVAPQVSTVGRYGPAMPQRIAAPVTGHYAPVTHAPAPYPSAPVCRSPRPGIPSCGNPGRARY